MRHPFLRRLHPLLLATALIGAVAYADTPPPASSPGAESSAAASPPSRHQLMKDCMAKQKAAGSGKPKYELNADCRDITKTEKENADTSKKQGDRESPADKAAPR